MSPIIVVGLVIGFIAIAAAVQASARQLQLFPVNPGSAGSLIGTDRQRTFTTTAFELEELRAIVSDSLASQGARFRIQGGEFEAVGRERPGAWKQTSASRPPGLSVTRTRAGVGGRRSFRAALARPSVAL